MRKTITAASVVGMMTLFAPVAQAEPATTTSPLVLSLDGQPFCEDAAHLEEAIKGAAAGSKEWVNAIPTCAAMGANHHIAVIDKSHWYKTLWLAKVRLLLPNNMSVVGYTVLSLQPEKPAEAKRGRPAARQPATTDAPARKFDI